MRIVKYFWTIRALVLKLFWRKIGMYTYIGKPCFIDGCRHIELGDKVRIFPGVRMEAMMGGNIIIGNNVAIEQNVHITCAESDLKIGNDVTILGNSFITNIEHNYKDINKSVLEQDICVIPTEIGDGCFIGFSAGIQAGTKLGRHCVVGAGSIVRGIFPDYCVIVGVPGKVVKMYNPEIKTWQDIRNE